MGTAALLSCLLLAASTYSVPPAVLLGIMTVEGGAVGQEVGPNRNGTYDLGPMQINTIWIPELAEHWQVDEATAQEWVRDDGCVNINVAAWILRGRINKTGHLVKGIAHYHSATPKYGVPYANRVLDAIDRLSKRR